jgi:membrane fusion protein (multidrug efflux system)
LNTPIPRSFRAVLAALTAVLLLPACGRQDPAGQTPRIPEVGVMVMRTQRLALGVQLPGRTVAYRIAQVRPQVTGIIKQRLFTEGANVTAGQALYQLDASTFKAAYDSAQAAVAKADANALTVKLRFDRYQKLAASGDVSQQDRDDVTANLSQAQADQATARALLETARINLGYTRIVAPISGRIGSSAFTEGALVTANQDSPLTTVQQYDPMFVDLSQSVSESTGAVTLRAIFPNPEGRLLPGMYVRAQVSQGVDDQALVVPQQVVTRDAHGEAVALVVGADDKAEQRTLKVSEAGDNQWRVNAGLNPGDRVIVQGLLNLRPGTVVKASAAAPVAAGASSASSAAGAPAAAR